MILKAGTYRFNNDLTFYDFINPKYDSFGNYYLNFDIPFTLGATVEDENLILEFFGLSLSYKSSQPDQMTMMYLAEDYPLPVYIDNAWRSDISPEEVAFIQTINVTKDTEVDDTFGAWFISNINYNEVNAKPLAEITYNGETIAQLNAGETATLSCEGKKMASDVTVKVNSILQGATAYTVSSVDELPTNAVDGSMAIVESDSEWLGVWEFKGELTRSDDIWGNAESGYSTLLLRAKMQDGFEVRKMNFAETYDGIYTLRYIGEMEHQNLDVYRTDELWGMPKGWLDESYKTLTLLKGLDGEGFATWWKSNAIRTVAHKLKTFYIRENGEWVYKCEVV